MRMPPPKPGTPVKPMTMPKGSMGPKVAPAKPVAPAGGGLNPAQWAATQEKAFLNVMKNGNLTPEQKTQAQADYKAQFGSLPKSMAAPAVVGGRGARDDAPRGPIAKPNMSQRGGPGGMAKGGMVKKGMAYGGMAKKGMNVGGMPTNAVIEKPTIPGNAPPQKATTPIKKKTTSVQNTMNAAAARAQADQKLDAEKQAKLADRMARVATDRAERQAKRQTRRSERDAERVRLEGPPRLGPDWDPYGRQRGGYEYDAELRARMDARLPTSMKSKEEARQMRELTGKAPRVVGQGQIKGGMKTGMNKGGMANCGASMKPTQNRGK